MDIFRLRTILKRLRSRSASALLETIVAFALIAITTLFLASGVTVSLGIYQSANELRDKMNDAEQVLLSADRKLETEYDATINNNVGELYYVEGNGMGGSSDAGEDLNVYTVCVQKSTDFNGMGFLLYYYDPTAWNKE